MKLMLIELLTNCMKMYSKCMKYFKKNFCPSSYKCEIENDCVRVEEWMDYIQSTCIALLLYYHDYNFVNITSNFVFTHNIIIITLNEY